MTIKETTQPDSFLIGQITGVLMYSSGMSPRVMVDEIRKFVIEYYEDQMARAGNLAEALTFSKDALERLTR